MARIYSTRNRNRCLVRVTGRLAASDIGRLEHACAPALTTAVPALDIDVSGTSGIDRTATAVLTHLGARGAGIAWPTAGRINAGETHETARRHGPCARRGHRIG